MTRKGLSRPLVRSLVRSVVAERDATVPPVEPPQGYVAPVVAFSAPAAMVETSDATYTYYTIAGSGTLTFDGAGAVTVEVIGGGGGGGAGTFTKGGGGGASCPVTGVVAVAAGTSYPIVIGSGGVGGISTPDTIGSSGGATTAFGLTSPGGGRGGHKGSGTNGLGAAGACGGGNTNTKTTAGQEAIGSLGGKGARGGSDDTTTLEAGAGGGAGGDAVRSTASGVLSVPGPGATSILGDTVCVGGGVVLSANGSIVAAKPATPSTAGSGGKGASSLSSAANEAGNGAAGRVVIRVPKTYVAPNLTVTEVPYAEYGYSIGPSLTSATATATVTVASGTGDVQVRVIDAAGAAVTGWSSAVTPVAGVATFAVTVPASAKLHRFEARMTGTAGETFRQTIPWYTSLHVVKYGQSNTALALTTSSANDTPNAPPAAPVTQALVIQCTNNSDQAVVNNDAAVPDPIVGPMTGLSDAPVNLVNELYALTGLPITVIWGGRSGTPSQSLVPGTSPFASLRQGIVKAGSTYIHGLIVIQGEGDSAPPDTWASSWLSNWQSIRTGVAALTGQAATSIRMLIGAIGTVSTEGGYSGTDDSWSLWRYRQQQIETEGLTNVFRGAHYYQHVRFQPWHYRGAGYGYAAKTEARRLAYHLGLATNIAPFTIASAARTSATVTTLTLTHGNGTDFTIETMTHIESGGTNALYDSPAVASRITSFQVSGDGGATWTAVPGAGVARGSATTITLTHADIGTGARLVRYMHGANPNGVVVDNSGYRIALDVTPITGIAAA